MNGTANTLARISNHMEESMGVRTVDSGPDLAPAPQSRDTGRRPLRGFGKVLIDQVVADPDQPRIEFSEGELDCLAKSIREKGQLMPIRVRWSQANAKWVIIFGERRWRAARRAGLSEIDCHFHDADLTAGEILEQQLVENCLREDLQPIEEARAFSRLMELNHWNGKELAEALRILPSRISRALALLRLPPDVQRMVDTGQVASRSAYELSKLDDAEAIQKLAAKIAAGRLPLDQTVQIVRNRKGSQNLHPRGVHLTFPTESGWKVIVSAPKLGTYFEVEQALEIALEEVRHRIKHDRRLS